MTTWIPWRKRPQTRANNPNCST